MRYGFTVYANSYDEAERIRNLVIELLQLNQYRPKEEGGSLPEWDVDGDVTDYGPEADEEEP